MTPIYKIHPNFKDIYWEVVSLKNYKPKYVDLKYFLHNRAGYQIFSSVQKIRIPESKWREFVKYEI